MPETRLPDGDYLSLAYVVRPGSGGQTRALLMRNRLLHDATGVKPRIVTLDDSPVYPEVREVLRDQRLLLDGVELLNIYEHYRSHPVDNLEPMAEGLPPTTGLDPVHDQHPDGTLYRTRHVNRKNARDTIVDYHRPDGSVFLRAPAPATIKKNQVTPLLLVDGQGRPVREWKTKGGFHRFWLHDLTPGDGNVFVISDSRFAIVELAPMKDPRFHLLHLVHNVHVGPPRRWNSTVSRTYAPVLGGISHLDALVTLTDRQRADIRTRYGNTNNLFVVPNPVEAPPRPDHLPQREAARFAVVSRLETQKRLDDALRAFCKVVADAPEARLDVYGDGTLRIALQELAEQLGIAHAVTFHGHDPRARDALATATGFLMTSIFEGYPLATLESMSHGCPVISYDIPYGPREQITDGVDGFLVEEGDVEGIAARALTMIRDPGLVARMSAAAYQKAASHGQSTFVRDWQTVLEEVVRLKPQRSRLVKVDLHVRELGYRRIPGLRSDRLNQARTSSAGWRSSRRIEFVGDLSVRGRSRGSTLDDATIVLEAVCEETSLLAEIPLRVRRDGHTFHLFARFDAKELLTALSNDSNEVWLRLTFAWNNSSWQTKLSRPRSKQPGFEVAYGSDGTLQLRRRDVASS